MQYFNPKNRALVIEALKLAHRTDLIGTGPECLIKPGPDTRDIIAKRDNSGKKSSKNDAKNMKNTGYHSNNKPKPRSNKWAKSKR